MGFGCDMRGIAWYGVIKTCLKLLPFGLLMGMICWIIFVPGIASLCVRGSTGVTDDGRVFNITHVEAWPAWPGFIYAGSTTRTIEARPEHGIPESAMTLPARIFVNEVTLE